METHFVVLRENLRDFPGFISGMVMVAVIWLLSAFSWLETIDHLYYDFVVDSIPQPHSAGHEVMLVETVPTATYDWEFLINRLVTAGARQIVFIAPLTDKDLRSLAASQHAAKLLIGRPLESHESRGVRLPYALPEDVANKLKVGIAAVPADESGSHRSQLSAYRAGPRILPTVEKVAAADAGRPDPSGAFLMNFHRGYELPRISVDRLERESPVAELVNGKTVLVGYALSPYLAQFEGPGRLLSQLEFHALATDTLLMDKVVRRAGIATKGGLMALLGLLLVLAFQPLRLLSAFWVALTLIAGMVALAWLSLRIFDVWLPTLELSLVTVMVFAMVYRAKAKAEDYRLRQLFTETSGKLEHRLQLTGFAESKEHWIYVVSLVDQILQLDRGIFLERIAGDHRVREIQSLRCSIGDIDEMRRDYQRFPYTDAIARGGMIEIDTVRRPFLKVGSQGERQFLIALTFGGEALGFWAFALSSEKIGNIEHFRAIVDSIAAQIGQLLYQRQLWITQNTLENQPWRRYLSDDTFHLYQKVSRAITALEQRTSNLEQMFAGLSTSAIVFDLFGRVILINDLMAHLLKGAGIAPFEMTVADFIEKLTGRSPDSVRQTIQTLLADVTPLLLPAVLPGKSPARFILYVRSLQHNPEAVAETSPFRISGLLLELIDGAELHRLYGMKSELVLHLNHQLNNDLTTMLGAIQMMNIDPASQEEMRGVIETQGHSAAATLSRVQELLAQEISIDYGGSYPVDPRSVILNAMERLKPVAAAREIGYDLRMQTTPFLIYANPREFDGTLDDCIGFLIGDAVEGSKVRIEVKVSTEHSTVSMSNTGFGIPQDRFDRILAGTAESESGNFEKLRLAARRIETWGGKVELRSELGEGYAFSIQLRTF